MGDTQNNKTGNTVEKRLWLIACFVFAFSFLLLLFLAFLAVRDYYGKNFNWHGLYMFEKSGSNQCVGCVRREIDGVLVKKEEAGVYPVAVIIENHPDARPSVALAKANLVYEAEVEGGITRYMAVYADGKNIEAIGPVRSARPYFVDWARELSAMLAHCGGSPEALAILAQGDIVDFNEFYFEDYFWRDKKIIAPHNIFTSTENLYRYLETKGIAGSVLLPWQYKDDLKLAERPSPGSEIIIGYQEPSYEVKWVYDRENNNYIRYLAGELHQDLSGEQIFAKNVIIEYIEAEVIDDKLRLKMNHVGSGKAMVCFDGTCAEGTWEKQTSASRTRFYNSNGEEIKFNAGTTWIEVVRPEREVLINS